MEATLNEIPVATRRAVSQVVDHDDVPAFDVEKEYTFSMRSFMLQAKQFGGNVYGTFADQFSNEETYSKEVFVAEPGAAYLSVMAGIEPNMEIHKFRKAGYSQQYIEYNQLNKKPLTDFRL